MKSLLLLDKLVETATLFMNIIGASEKVSAIVAKRIAEGGRSWTDEERQEVLGELQSAKAYARAELAKPD